MHHLRKGEFKSGDKYGSKKNHTQKLKTEKGTKHGGRDSQCKLHQH